MSDSTELLQPWERQPGEGSKAFQAFVQYRDLGPDERSLRETARRLGKSSTIVARWSATHRWVERVAAHDVEQDRIRRRANERAIIRMAEQHAQIAAAVEGKVTERLLSIQPDDLTPQDLARWLELAVKVRREALGASGPPIQFEEVGANAEQRGEIARRILEDDEATGMALDLLRRVSRRPAGSAEPSRPETQEGQDEA